VFTIGFIRNKLAQRKVQAASAATVSAEVVTKRTRRHLDELEVKVAISCNTLILIYLYSDQIMRSPVHFRSSVVRKPQVLEWPKVGLGILSLIENLGPVSAESENRP
jgi:hypothetical protein